jgi:hypothetical protein
MSFEDLNFSSVEHVWIVYHVAESIEAQVDTHYVKENVV